MPGSGFPLHFGAPLGLLFLLAVPVVLWLHLRRRNTPSAIVPSLVPWQTLLVERPSSRRRIPASVLLAMHVAVAMLIALALADPRVITDGASAADRAVVLDVSTSMGAGNRWAEAGDRVRDLANATSGRFTLVTAGPRPRVLLWRSPDAALVDAALAGPSPGGTGSDVARAIALAEAVAGPEAALHVVADGAQAPSPRDDGRVVWSAVGEPADNLAITHADARRMRGETRLFVRVANFSQQARSVELKLLLDGRPHDQKTIDVAAGGTAETIWRVAEAAEIAELRLDGRDALAADDFALVPLDPMRPSVSLVGGSESVARALEAIPTIHVRPRGEGADGADSGTDVTVFTGVVPDTLPAGGVVVFAPDAGELATPRIEPQGAVVDTGSGHPIAWGLDLRGARLDGVTDPEIPDWAETVLRADGRNVAFAGTRLASRVVVFAFDPDRGDVAARLAFPLLVARAVTWAANRSPDSVVTAGEAIGLLPAPMWVRSPADDKGYAWGTLEDTSQPGLYRVSSEADQGDPFASYGVLAGDLAESDLRRGGDSESGRGVVLPAVVPHVPL